MSDTRRVLLTGLSTYWGGRLAQALEAFEDVETIIGVDSEEPRIELERTEYVKVSNQHGLLARIVKAAQIDTVIDTRLTVNSVSASPRGAHENNVIGTMNILTACSGQDSPVRQFIFKSSAYYYGSEQDDPAFFHEGMLRPHPPRTPLERDIVEAETAVAEFAEKRPEMEVTILRCANVLGPDVDTAFTRMFDLPAVPMVLGFDPRIQFVHEDDVVHALEHCVFHDTPGVFNVAADGVLVVERGGIGPGQADRAGPAAVGNGPRRRAAQEPRLQGSERDAQPDALRARPGQPPVQGDGLRIRAHLARGGGKARTSTCGLIRSCAASMAGYRYEREVEEFLRWSPHVQRDRPGEKTGVEADSDLLGI